MIALGSRIPVGTRLASGMRTPHGTLPAYRLDTGVVVVLEAAVQRSGGGLPPGRRIAFFARDLGRVTIGRLVSDFHSFGGGPRGGAA